MKKEKDLPVLLALDPSVRSMGWATVNLNNAEGDHYDLENPLVWNYGLITMEPTKQVQYRWEQAKKQLEEALGLDELTPTHFASEWPTFFNSMKGRIAAQENYTVGLAGIVGYLAGVFKFKGEHIVLWTPQQWKGNTPKNVTRNQFVLYFGDYGKQLAKTASDDVIDAIMIARHWLTLYDRERFYWQKQSKGGYYALNKEGEKNTGKHEETIRR
jgi:Holliday junction resolvasome RuvABC endonuclease subunit